MRKRLRRLVLLVCYALALTACGVLTGISSYGICENDSDCIAGSPTSNADANEATGADALLNNGDSNVVLDSGIGSPDSDAGCIAPMADCDPSPGCETNTSTSREHCGGCGAPCKAGEICSNSKCNTLASCKAIRDAISSSTTGVYPISNDGGVSVYCEMTLNGGGWTLIANVPPASKGYWEQNASTKSITSFPTNIATSSGMMLPSIVSATGLPYTEVLFTDTETNNWFTVDKTSDFYLHNYRGACGDPSVETNNSFAITGRSVGNGTTLYAWWASGCPNGTDTVTNGSQSCNALFVNFDNACANNPATTLVRVYVR